jgi:hypothetical protein
VPVVSSYDESLPPDEKHDPRAEAPLDPESREIQDQFDELEDDGIVPPDSESEREETSEDDVDDPEGHPGRGGD